MSQHYDVVIIGGGINGCGVAADASSRGLSVFLCEQDDLASKTSSSSTKLIHGGLRYLEHYDFKLVHKALDERQTLLSLAPHLVHPIPIVLPYQQSMRPAWVLRLGLFFYDYLSRHNTLPKSKFIKRQKQPVYFSPLDTHIKKGFIFYDGMTDDARLTIANALQAKAFGALISSQTELLKAEVIDHKWQLSLQNRAGEMFSITAGAVVNAAGPWVTRVNQLFNIPLAHPMSLIKGSHLVVHKLYEGNHAYLLQHDDHRIVFVIPYLNHTLIGTTDVAYTGPLDEISIDTQEVRYLCDLVNHYFNKRLQEEDIIRSWSGVRPLLAENGKDPMALSRDYAFHYVDEPLPFVTIYSGKMTTYRQLSKEVVDALKTTFTQMPASITHKTPLPGSKLNGMSFVEYQQQAYQTYYWLDEEILTRYLQNYGTRTELILQSCKCMEDLGIQFTGSLYQKEVDYLVREEWACHTEDILWRRTKLGLTADADSRRQLSLYLSQLRPNE